MLDYLDDSNVPVFQIPLPKALIEAICGKLNGRTFYYYIPNEN